MIVDVSFVVQETMVQSRLMNRSSLQNLWNSLRWLIITVRLFSNWPQIYWHRFFTKQKTLIFRLRSGVQFKVTDKNTMVPTIVDIWYKHMYGDLSVLAGVASPRVIDIGGHIGVFSLFVLSKFPAARVIAFEPNKENFDCLSQNIAMNHFSSHCTAVEKAVAGTAGPRTFFISSSSVNGSIVTHTKTVGETQVQCLTLQDVLSEYAIATCDLLKIDCEGGEYEILMKAPPEVYANINNILLEWHAVPGVGADDLSSFLSAQGYTVQLSPKSTTHSEGFLTARK